MNPQDAVDMTRESLMISLLISSPVLIAGLVIGLIVGLLQALTQIQEQTVAFVPKLIVMAGVFLVTLPWVLNQFQQYVIELFTQIPSTL